jgi:uncharacterized protein (TIGR04255 family)
MATAAAPDGFRPVHDAHAIEQLVATIQFDRPLPDDTIRAANETMAQFQESLPGRSDIRGMGFQFGPGGLVPVMPAVAESPSGVLRSFTDGRGVVLKELRVDRQVMVFRTQAYTRWDAVWAEAHRYFSALLPLIEAVNVASFGLAYVDKFIWTGRPETCRSRDLFQAGSPYLAPRSLESQDLWHCHSGQFRIGDPSSKRLEVVDIDCVDELAEMQGSSTQMQRVVRISTNITDIFNQPGYEPRQISGSNAVLETARAFPMLHEELKRVFSEIISYEAAAQVGLNNNDA